MTPDVALDSVTELRAAAFDLLEAATDRELTFSSRLSEAVYHLQVVANELGVVEELLGSARVSRELHIVR